MTANPKVYKLHRLELSNYNKSLTEQLNFIYSDFSIQESLHTPFMFGTIDIKDSSNILGRFPMCGQETLIVDWTDNEVSEHRIHTFNVYKISNRQRIGDSEGYSYRLHFISPEGMANVNKIISRGYQGTKASEAVSDLFGEIGTTKNIRIEDSDVALSFTVNRQTTAEAIQWISTFATSRHHPGSSYVFFENKYGFNFVTLNSLLSKPATKQISSMMKMVVKDDEQAAYDGLAYFSVNQADMLDASQNNVFYQNLQVIDPQVRTIEDREYDYQRDYGQFTRLTTSSNPTFANSGLATSGASPLLILKNKQLKTQTAKTVTTRSGLVTNTYAKQKLGTVNYTVKREDQDLTRWAELKQLGYILMLGHLPGDVTMTVGDIVQVKIPAATKEPGDEFADVHLSGNYMVASITHVFRQETYQMIVELMRNCLSYKIEG